MKLVWNKIWRKKKTNYQNIARKNIYLKNHQSFGHLNSVTCNCHVLKFSIEKLCEHEYDMFLFLMAWVFGKKRKWTSTWFVSCCSVWSLGCLHLLAAHCSVLLLLLFFVDFFLFGVCVLTCISFSFVHFTCWLMENVGGSCSIVFKSASSYCSAGQLLKWKERTSQWSCKLTLWGKCDQTTDVAQLSRKTGNSRGRFSLK